MRQCKHDRVQSTMISTMSSTMSSTMIPTMSSTMKSTMSSTKHYTMTSTMNSTMISTMDSTMNSSSVRTTPIPRQYHASTTSIPRQYHTNTMSIPRQDHANPTSYLLTTCILKGAVRPRLSTCGRRVHEQIGKQTYHVHYQCDTATEQTEQYYENHVYDLRGPTETYWDLN